MKLTNTQTKKSRKGMTLIELTVVILVLLSLISVLFIGARAWMRGSDRANAALLIRNAQQGVRSHANIMGVESITTEQDWANVGDGNNLADAVFGPGAFVETDTIGTPPGHPDAGNSFVAAGSSFEHIPPVGDLYMTSANNATFFEPDL